jgi:ferredoxin-thioredoxin reductase catalytic subunit
MKITRKIFEKHSNIEFHENPSTGSRVIPCRRIDGQTNMTKLIICFCNIANVPLNKKSVYE